MDLRKLYEAIVASEHLRRTHRVFINQKCYAITYEIHHKILTIKNIKRLPRSRIHKKESLNKNIYESCAPFDAPKSVRLRINRLGRRRKTQRFKREEHSLQSQLSKGGSIKKIETANVKQQTERLVSIEQLVQTDPPEQKTVPTQVIEKVTDRKTTQTAVKLFKSQQTYMEPVLSYTKCEQTATSVYSQGTQADEEPKPILVSCGLNTKPQTSNIANQTEECYCTMGTQTTPVTFSAEIQADLEHLEDYELLKNKNNRLSITLNEVKSSLSSQNSKFDHVAKSVEELLSWFMCFQNFYKLHKKKKSNKNVLKFMKTHLMLSEEGTSTISISK